MRKTPRSIKKLIRRIKYWQEQLKTALNYKPPKRSKRIKKRRKTKSWMLKLSGMMEQKSRSKRKKIKKRRKSKPWWQKLLATLFPKTQAKPQPQHQEKRRVRRRKPLYR